MNLLLDTHVFLWFINGDAKLPTAWDQAITDPANKVFLSVVSVWEATIKFQIGKLRFQTHLKAIYRRNGRGIPSCLSPWMSEAWHALRPCLLITVIHSTAF